MAKKRAMQVNAILLERDGLTLVFKPPRSGIRKSKSTGRFDLYGARVIALQSGHLPDSPRSDFLG
jgi:hypothetical protein